MGQLRGGEAARGGGQSQDCLHGPAYTPPVEIDPSHLRLAYLRGRRQLFQSGIAEKTLVDATQDIHKSLHNALQPPHDLRKFFQPISTSEFLDVVSDGLHPKHAFAFGIDLQRKQAATQFENRQIIHRSLDRHFPGHPLLSSCSLGWTTLDPQHGLDLFHIQGTLASIHQSLKHLFHQPALGEPQIPAVLDLIDATIVNVAGLAKIADTLSESLAIGQLRQVCERWIYSSCLCFALDSEEQERSRFQYQYSVNCLLQAGNPPPEFGGRAHSPAGDD